MLNYSPRQNFSLLQSTLRAGMGVKSQGGMLFALEYMTADNFHEIQSIGGAELWFFPTRSAHEKKIPQSTTIQHFSSTSEILERAFHNGLNVQTHATVSPSHALNFLQFLQNAQILPIGIFLPNYIHENAMSFSSHVECKDSVPLLEIAQAALPTEIAGLGAFRVFREEGGGLEHFALSVGDWQNTDAPLVRIHSACFTGDCLGSQKCDCGPQLHSALVQIHAHSGILIYLSQEGRGVGIANKIRAYALQEQGYDTFEANNILGFPDDLRDYSIAVNILKKLDINRVQLLTNNPLKTRALQNSGIEIAAELPLRIEKNAHNSEYLLSKKLKSGHNL